jgi:hypothetical protein
MHPYTTTTTTTVPQILCGGNIDTPILGRVMERGLAADGTANGHDMTNFDQFRKIVCFMWLLSTL